MLWLKTAGVVLIITGSGFWGLINAQRMSRRVEQIKKLRLAMGFLEKEVTCIYTPLSRAFTRTALFCDAPVSLLFSKSAALLENRTGITAAEAWRSGLQYLAKESELSKEDLDLLDEVALQLGMSDADEQRKFFAFIQEELRIQEEKAREEAESGQKLWSYGGFIIGSAVVLLLI